MLFANILLGFSCLVSLFLGLFILVSNPRKGENRALAAFLFAFLVWLLANLFTNISKDPSLALAFGRSTLVGPILLSLCFYIFARVFTSVSTVAPKRLVISAFPAAVILLFTPTKYNIESIGSYGANTKVGIIYTVLIPVILGYIGVALTLLYRYFRHTKEVLKKQQIRYIFLGVLAALLPGIIINAILPLMGDYTANLYGPNVIIFLAIFMSIAIIRHRLLDIRFIVARSLTYLLLLATVVILYGVLVFGLSSKIIPDANNLGVLARLFYISFAIIMAISYQPLKRFFDKVTNKFFFQDIYDSQEVLDKVSSIIVGNVDPHKLQKGALSTLVDALKVESMSFLLTDQECSLKIGDSIGRKWQTLLDSGVTITLKGVGRRIFVYDEPETHNNRLRDLLRAEGISLVAPLVTKEEVVGYLIVGPKKSGNLFSTQDIQLLTIATNELAVALQNAQRFEEIQAFNVTLQRRVEDATRELKSTNKKLVALDEAKDEFISMASHQLRTPLTSIKGYLSMAIEGDLGKLAPQQEKALKEAFGSSQRMVFLIADFLNVSRIKTGKFLIEPKEVYLPEIVREELTQLKEMAEAKDLKLVYDQPEVFPKVMLDDNKIRQVMMNMVDNAIYYTPNGGTITIQLYPTADEIIFKVVDNGIGVPKTEQHKLFTKFYRAGNARKARPDGTGLGLFMAQKIVVEQSGAIIFESQEGKGSTFGFRFPIAKIKAPEE